VSSIPNQKFIFLIISIHIVAVIAVSSLVLSAQRSSILGKETFIGVVSVENQTVDDAIRLSKEYYDEYLKNGQFEFLIEDYHFNIPFNEIDLKIDYNKLKEEIEKSYKDNEFTNLINEQKSNNKTNTIIPELDINEGKLKGILEFYAQRMYSPSIDANVYLYNEQIAINEASLGMKLNIENSMKTILENAFSNLEAPFVFRLEDNYEVQRVNPKITKKSFEKYKDLLVYYTLSLDRDDSISELINNYTFVINDGDEFSIKRELLQDLEAYDINDKKTAELVDKLASCIHATALQLADNKIIERNFAHKPTEYIDPGLEAVLLNEDDDLRFVNKTGKDYMMVIQQEGFRLTVAFLGEKSNTDKIYSIESQTVKRLKPMTIYSQNPKIKENETRVLVEGEYGQIVNVYGRIKTGNLEQSTKIKLHENTYSPSERIIEIGTGVRIEELK